MRLFVKHPDASFVVSGGNQYPVKNQVADVPEDVGASLLVFGEYEVFNNQTELHEDFVKFDAEASAQALKDAEVIAKEQAEKELAAAKEVYEAAVREADRLKAIYEGLLPKKKAKTDTNESA